MEMQLRGFLYKGICQKFAQTAGQILDHSALSSGSFGTGRSCGLEAVKVDAERDNEMFQQCAPPASDQQLCVTLSHAHVQTHSSKGKMGNRDNRKDCFSSGADTNAIIQTKCNIPHKLL